MDTPIRRLVFNILVKDLATSAAFYRQLAGFEQIHTSSWQIVMTVPGSEAIELGLIDEVSEFAPRHARQAMLGTYLTLVVDDVYETLERARALGVEIIEEPFALANGLTRALIRDPNGLVIEVSTPTADIIERSEGLFTPEFKDPAIDQQQP